MTRIKEALTRKFGPLPAWAWLLMLFGAVYYYRKHYGSTATTTTSTTPTPTTTGSDQPPITLDPGQSVYDPATGALTTAPGAGGGGDVTGGSGGGGGGGGLGTSTVPPGGTFPNGSGPFPFPNGSGPADATVADTNSPAVSSILNAVKPPPHITNRKHGKPPRRVKFPGRPRSRAAINNKSHTPFRVVMRVGGSHVVGAPRRVVHAARSRVVKRTGGAHVVGAPRQRPTTRFVRPVVRQRPVASAPPPRPAPPPPPRPSAPPPRPAPRPRHHPRPTRFGGHR